MPELEQLLTVLSLLIILPTFVYWHVWHRKQYLKRYRIENRSEFYKTAEWKKKSKAVLERDKHTCVHCGEKANKVQHVEYSEINFSNSPMERLESVCDSCFKPNIR